MACRNYMYETTFVSTVARYDCLAESRFVKHSEPFAWPARIDCESRGNNKSSMLNLRKSLSLNSLVVAVTGDFSSESSVESLRTFSSYENLSSSAAASRSESRPSISSFESDSHAYRTKSRSRHFLKNLLHFSKKKIVHMLSPISDKSYPDISLIEGRASSAVGPKPLVDGHICDRDNGEIGGNSNSNSSSTSSSGKDQKHSDSGHAMTINKFDLIKKIDLQIDFDSGISIQSSNASDNVLLDSFNDFEDLPFEMPKLTKRIKSIAQRKKADEPFALKATTRLDNTFTKNDTVRVPPSLSLQLPLHNSNERATRDRTFRTNLSLTGLSVAPIAIQPTQPVTIDADLPLNYQNWYHGLIDRHESENQLRAHSEGSFLVRSRNSNQSVYILSIKSMLGYFHVRIKNDSSSRYSLTDSKTSFASIPELIRYYSVNRLCCIRGAEHLILSNPIEVRLL